MRKIFTLLSVLAVSATVMFAQDQLPSNPEPGKCYVKCVTPDEYKTETVQIMSKPAFKKLSVVPAQYKTVEEKIMTKPASKKYIYHPAVFETYTEDYEAEQPHKKLSIIPATFGSGSETIIVEPASAGWEYGDPYSGCQSDDPRDCRVLCYVAYDEVKETFTKTTLSKDATTTSTTIPGKTSSVTKQRIVKEAYVEEIAIPAEFKNITKRVLVKDELVTEVGVPAEFRTITKEALVKKGGLTVWEEVACELTSFNLIPIYYELGSARLTTASKKVIDEKLYSLMTQKPNISIELNSHTDSRGTTSANQALSQSRANAVVNYLVSKGINKNRLVAEGFGESRLVNNCADGVTCTEGQHQKNRRTEFRIISK